MQHHEICTYWVLLHPRQWCILRWYMPRSFCMARNALGSRIVSCIQDIQVLGILKYHLSIALQRKVYTRQGALASLLPAAWLLLLQMHPLLLLSLAQHPSKPALPPQVQLHHLMQPPLLLPLLLLALLLQPLLLRLLPLLLAFQLPGTALMMLPHQAGYILLDNRCRL